MKEYSLIGASQWTGQQRMSEPLEQASHQRVTPQVNLHKQLSSSAPERRSIYRYDVRQVPLGKSLSSVSLPANLKTSSGKVSQLARLVGYDFYHIDNYGESVISNHLRIPILEGLFADAKKGKALPSVSDVLENRKQRVYEPGYETGLQEETAETVFFYLHLLLFLHTRGVPNIEKLASYFRVKSALIGYWNYCLVSSQTVAEYLLESCKAASKSCDQDDGNGVLFDVAKEETVLELFGVSVETVDIKYKTNPASTDQRADSAHNQSNSSFTSHNLVNMLLDFLCLGSEGESERVVKSLPKRVVEFLDKEYGT